MLAAAVVVVTVQLHAMPESDPDLAFGRGLVMKWWKRWERRKRGFGGMARLQTTGAYLIDEGGGGKKLKWHYEYRTDGHRTKRTYIGKGEEESSKP